MFSFIIVVYAWDRLSLFNEDEQITINGKAVLFQWISAKKKRKRVFCFILFQHLHNHLWWCLVISSFCHFVISSFCHVIILSFHHFVVSSFWYAIILSCHHFVMSSFCHVIILSLHQSVILLLGTKWRISEWQILAK